MRDRVAPCLSRAEAGALVIDSATVRGQRLTLSTLRAGDGRRLSECAGLANREPAPPPVGVAQRTGAPPPGCSAPTGWVPPRAVTGR